MINIPDVNKLMVAFT